jgi:protein-S-isoprenylcysteine O-methyltransferase Ste14
MLRTIIGSILLVTLMVCGWGSLDFFKQIPHVIIFLSGLIAPFVIPRSKNSAVKYGKERGESSLQFLFLAFLSTVGVGFLLPFFAGHKVGVIPFSEPIRYLGVLVFLSGYWIRAVATRTLKKQFSYLVTIQEHHQLITSGIYSLIRHPVYLGTILAVIGMFMVFSTWFGLAFLFVYSALLIHRMSLEEKLLFKYFGSVYQEYSLKSFRLIPHIY